jgi:hypothetical protein
MRSLTFTRPGFERIDETIERFRAKTFGENYAARRKVGGERTSD